MSLDALRSGAGIDIWVLDPLPFGEAAKGTFAPDAITNRHAEDTA
jgi:hypothetical protein